MTKAFIVEFKSKVHIPNQISGSMGYGGSTTIYNSTDNRPIIVIANNIGDVGKKYPDAISIMEHDVREVVILDKVICPLKGE